MAKTQACRNCHMVVSKGVCPLCKSTSSLSDEWSGLVVIIDPKTSLIAKKLNINVPGTYALRVR
ncbi:MAG: DNA-directed RNA polymerase subunit E'' [Methanobacteriota archaeon]|nr:MAG: DNA-directed RNA polymerase subunit E'' [Euryarchaeota archaeon]